MGGKPSTPLDVISASAGPRDFPARIYSTPAALKRLAAARLAANINLRAVCDALRDPNETDDLDSYRHSAAKPFTDDDAKVVAFFLERNTGCKKLE